MKRLRFWSGGIVTLLILGTAIAYFTLHGRVGGSGNARPSRPIPVTAGIAEAKDFPIYRIGLGTVQAYNTVTIKVRVDGEVQKIAFREGQDVQPGDLLAQIDPRPYQALLEQAEADKLRDEALLANAKLDLGRIRPLLAQDFATRQSFDTQNTLIAQYQAAIQHDQAAIDNARVQLGYTTISSPIQGRTGVRLIDQGNIVHPTDSSGLVVITQLKPISVIFTLPQQFLPEITDAMRKGRLAVLATIRTTKSSSARVTSNSLTIRSTRPRAPRVSRPSSQTRMSGCGRANSSMRGCGSRRTAARSSRPPQCKPAPTATMLMSSSRTPRSNCGRCASPPSNKVRR